MKILVTGGAGFIGSHYVRAVLGGAWGSDSPEGVVVLDKLTYAGSLENLAEHLEDHRLTFVRGDICDDGLVDRLVSSVDVLVHFAAESHVDRSIRNAAEFVATNVVGTQTLLDAARRHRLDRFVHVSTDEVYGSVDTGSWTEDAPLRPGSPYAASKASADLLALAAHHTHGLPVVITRGANTYGTHQHPEKVIPCFVTNLLVGQPLPLYGDGHNVREWLHVDDHCRAVHSVLVSGVPGEVYNVGGGTELRNIELAARIVELMGAGAGMIRHVADRPGHDRRYSVDAGKSLDELGFRPRVPFDAGLRETVAWFGDNRWWWEPRRAGQSRGCST